MTSEQWIRFVVRGIYLASLSAKTQPRMPSSLGGNSSTTNFGVRRGGSGSE